eukprot:CAMPEP_0172615266 /NCGR_PEP_ID=MMETSP1068-20121228/57144_1 /TAXON_ID=35684 /ORGANISM="Pseudopedinella elastica, Strain CCMP716" /LENGTH=109 /DNA_ID=CAMNT_0013420343 /DNA_START=509 /DNA_END=838 /DNA_ORIENTATION=+
MVTDMEAITIDTWTHDIKVRSLAKKTLASTFTAGWERVAPWGLAAFCPPASHAQKPPLWAGCPRGWEAPLLAKGIGLNAWTSAAPGSCSGSFGDSSIYGRPADGERGTK